MADNSQSRTERRKQQQKQQKSKPLWKRLFKYALIAVLLFGLGVGVLFSYYVITAPKLDAALLSDPTTTNLYDINEEVFAKLGAEKRTKITYDDLPPVLIDAILATEDVRFNEHIGIDFRRIGGAILANIRDGFGAQGASTITQQVVKSSFLTNDKQLKRKVQEQWLALRLDARYSKEEIFEMYVNKIYYGAGAYGVAMAAEIYFGKTDLNDLTLTEAAILAGLPQRPSAYDPFVNPDLTEQRMNTVLNYMVQHNKISEEEADEARDVNIEDLLADKRPDFVKYESFIQQVRDEVMEKTGADIYEDGLEVYTTLDPNAQEHVELLLSDSENNPVSYGGDDELQAGLVVMDTQMGAIRAIGGGRNRENDGWNYAIDGDGRQGGSAMKPIIAYGPAIEYLKWSTYEQINDDKPYEVAGSSAPIRNWNRQYQGWMSARYALQWSLNVPAAKAFEEVGTNNVKEFSDNLGFDFENVSVRDAIGGTDNGVTPLQMAGAYSAFGNEGIYHEPYSVISITYPDERTEELEPESEIAMSDYTAYMVTDMLKTVVQSGTGTDAAVPGVPIAGKTGTTNLEDEPGSPDSWFVGYSTNYTVSVWTGYDKRKAISDTNIAKHLFRETMTYLSQNIETQDFTMPDSVVEMDIERGSNPAQRPSSFTPSSQIVTELFVKGTEPGSGAVSERFEELEAVSGLSAEYNEDEDKIVASWDHDKSGVEFRISAGTDGSLEELTTTKKKQIEISNVEKGQSYTIEVVAFNDEMESDPASVTVDTASEESEDLPAVSGLQQSFDAENRSALISWQYSHDGPIEFDISVQQSGETIDNFNTSQQSVNITQLELGTTYTIHVTPVLTSDGTRGPSASVQVSTEGMEEDEPDEDETEEPVPPDESEEEQPEDNTEEEPEQPANETEQEEPQQEEDNEDTSDQETTEDQEQQTEDQPSQTEQPSNDGADETE
ncbi:PBP1A family penicillin-binding protein [Gracilibacillus alcaliphilus]|uniref:PBP1A family penicillin-binding protein n=1 Tax=Gracilibacillus alcaliphilus TaxID=1401441 RepID=UPI001959E014|nr:PBP1A family penicillin-binding protein [Gracilibacillus alcaliphilus]MBM7675223.1 penicillin-binding protein 1A [Gracilibacillus alcaliphilus]